MHKASDFESRRGLIPMAGDIRSKNQTPRSSSSALRHWIVSVTRWDDPGWSAVIWAKIRRDRWRDIPRFIVALLQYKGGLCACIDYSTQRRYIFQELRVFSCMPASLTTFRSRICHMHIPWLRKWCTVTEDSAFLAQTRELGGVWLGANVGCPDMRNWDLRLYTDQSRMAGMFTSETYRNYSLPRPFWPSRGQR